VPLREPELFLKENFESSHIMIAMPHPKGYHFVLLEDFLHSDIVIADPEDCERHRENLSALYEKMFQEESGGFDLVSRSS